MLCWHNGNGTHEWDLHNSGPSLVVLCDLQGTDVNDIIFLKCHGPDLDRYTYCHANESTNSTSGFIIEGSVSTDKI